MFGDINKQFDELLKEMRAIKEELKLINAGMDKIIDWGVNTKT